jgi:hypothetical protein
VRYVVFQGVSQSEADAWADDIRALGSSGDYFFNYSEYIFTADKPESPVREWQPAVTQWCIICVGNRQRSWHERRPHCPALPSFRHRISLRPAKVRFERWSQRVLGVDSAVEECHCTRAPGRSEVAAKLN